MPPRSSRFHFLGLYASFCLLSSLCLASSLTFDIILVISLIGRISHLYSLHCTPLTRALVQGGVAVMGHIGLTPQSYSVIGGFRAQVRSTVCATLPN